MRYRAAGYWWAVSNWRATALMVLRPGRPDGRRERGFAGEQPVEAAARRVDADPAADGRVGQHLSGGVGDGGHHRADGGQVGVVEGAGDPEVAEQDAFVRASGSRPQEGGGVDGAMHHLVGVGEVGGFGDLGDDVCGAGNSGGCDTRRPPTRPQSD